MSNGVEFDERVGELSDDKKILIVTEGSSDTRILRKTINDMYDDISDFFNFIDMKENYPFVGVGELYNFCKGLCKINVKNNIIVIFDNDTAGIEKYNESLKLKKPTNLLITKLPNHTDFNVFTTIGPQGETDEDINGRAVAIECFLDFESQNPYVRWTAYIKKMKEYQGAIERKDEYVENFNKKCLTDGSYNTSKLVFLIDDIIKKWIERKK